MTTEFALRVTVHAKLGRTPTVEARLFLNRKDGTWYRVGTLNVPTYVWYRWLLPMLGNGADIMQVALKVEDPKKR